MRLRLWSVGILLLGLVPSFARADNTPTLTNLTQSEADTIAKNFGNAIVFRSLEPPSANGKIWGFGLGLVFDATSAGHVNEVLRAHGNSQDISALPAGDIVGTVQLPLGIAAEIGFLPRVSIKGFSAVRTGFNAKWTFTDVFFHDRLPFNAALRMGYGKNEFKYGQTTSGVADTVEFDSKAFRTELALSPRLPLIEPYLGFGLISTSSTLKNTATASIYNFTTANSYDYSKSSFLFNLGFEFRLLVLAASAQVEWAFGETTGSAKLGLKF
ncbi:MAG: hypothetical protein JST04_01370 [Bdellovibrionales bacterium]|nr:hypothetical protein [Bdellovibrionales bacterium]